MQNKYGGVGAALLTLRNEKAMHAVTVAIKMHAQLHSVNYVPP